MSLGKIFSHRDGARANGKRPSAKRVVLRYSRWGYELIHTQRSRIVNLAQVIKGLRAERNGAQKEVDRLEKAIGALQKLGGNPGRHAQENETGKGGDLPPRRGKGFRRRRKRAGERFDDRGRPWPEADAN